MLIFSDLHFGIDKNSDKRIEDVNNVLKWIASCAKKYNEKVCVFAGDWLHDRDEIDVKTAIKAKEGLEFVAKSFDKFYFIAGNHDYYYNNSSEISSASLFTDVRNVTVIKDKPEVIEENGKKIILAPWFYNPSEEVARYDAMIGHFEFIGGKMAGGFSKIGHNPNSMLSVASLVFTGHYHLSSELDKENGKIVTIGSPYEQDWGDCGNKKRIIIFDGTSWDSIYNDISPIHYKIEYSKLSSIDDEKLSKLFSNGVIKTSFVKIVSGSENGSVEGMSRILSIASSCGVRKIEADYSMMKDSINESIDGGIEQISKKDIKSYVHDFVDNCITNCQEFNAVSSEESHKLIDSYFDQVNGVKTK